MEITRNIILDLLPLYLAGEVSSDTQALVEKFLEDDQELANVAKQLAASEKPKDVPAPVSQEDTMYAYRKARQRTLIFAVALAGVISAVLIITVFVFFFGSSQ